MKKKIPYCTIALHCSLIKVGSLVILSLLPSAQVRYKKLKENVSKIKSHLPVDDISNFRDLDLQGKLNTTGQSGVNLGSAIKIAAAARRLNLGAGMKRKSRTRSALPTIAVQRDLAQDRDGLLDMRNKSVVSINDPPVVDRIKRSNSITGVFMDAPDGDSNGTGAHKHRPASAFLPHHRRQITRPQTVNGLSSSSRANKTNVQSNTSQNIEQNRNKNGTAKGIPNSNSRSNSITPPSESVTTLTLPMNSLKDPIADNEADSAPPAIGFFPIKETLSLPNAANEGSNNPGEASPDPMPTFRSTSSIFHRPRSPFSSHCPAPRRASAPARQRRMSHISVDSIDR